MRALLLPVLLVAVSCGPSATLFTDSVFRAAVPEVAAAWSELPPWQGAALRELPRDAFGALKEALPHVGGSALIGALLTSSERSSLTAAFPSLRLVFFVSEPAAGQAGIVVDRETAWAVVAEKAAASRTPATAIFPADVTPEELDRFGSAWSQAGGGTLTTLVWPVTSVPGSDPVFQWAGSSAESLIRTLALGRTVHTDPGMDRPPQSKGLTWRIRRAGLADFLWKAASEHAKTVYFLPLEAIPNSRL